MKKELNAIGIEVEKAENLAGNLNVLLSNYQVFYMNIRGLHWNIKGEKFFELHAKFEELYTDLFNKIDEVAERVLTLGYIPYHSFSDFINHSEVRERQNVTEAHDCVEVVLDGLRSIISLQREILDLSAEAGDEGTNSMMSDYIREQEKMVWMYSAFQG